MRSKILNNQQIKSRLAFAKAHKNWTYSEWKRCLFSDESKFNLFGSDSSSKVWCTKGNFLNQKNINAIKKFGGGNLMVWGIITPMGVGKIIKITDIFNKY